MKVVHYHYATLPYVNTLTNLAVGFEPTCSRSTSGTATIPVNVFAYGRGTENRTLIYGLKARYFAVKLYPHMVRSQRIELC